MLTFKKILNGLIQNHVTFPFWPSTRAFTLKLNKLPVICISPIIIILMSFNTIVHLFEAIVLYLLKWYYYWWRTIQSHVHSVHNRLARTSNMKWKCERMHSVADTSFDWHPSDYSLRQIRTGGAWTDLNKDSEL